MDCPKCDTEVPESSRTCLACETNVGFPNVRVAENMDNIEAIKKRVEEANVSTKARKCDQILKDFGEKVSFSKAIRCLSLSVAKQVLESDNELFSTFYQKVASKQKVPQNNEWDRARESVESKLFPGYHSEIHCAFLSLTNNILGNYGDCGLILKEEAIADRATVFEKNPILFFEEFLIAGRKPVPHGYRSIWRQRNMIAMAKLHPKFSDSTTCNDYSSILYCDSKKNEETDFIEVHIFGTLHRRSVEHVIVKAAKSKADKVIQRSLKNSLGEIGVSLEVIS
tara:strand:- start:2801 stop:3646 length:846 start_codon:yes stop_codon:yes gene_type:complete